MSSVNQVAHSEVLAQWSYRLEDEPYRMSLFEINRGFSFPSRRTNEREDMLLPFRAVDDAFWRSESGGFDLAIPDEKLAAVARVDQSGASEVFSDGRPAVARVGIVAPGSHVFLTERIDDAHALHMGARASSFVVPSVADIERVAKALTDVDPSLSITVLSTSLPPGVTQIEGATVFDLPRWLEEMNIPPSTTPHGLEGAFGGRLTQQLASDALLVKPEVVWVSPWTESADGQILRTVVGRRGDHLFAGTQAMSEGKESSVVWSMEPRMSSMEEASEHAKALLAKVAPSQDGNTPSVAPSQPSAGEISGTQHADVPIARTDDLLAELKKSFIVAGSNFYLRDDKKILAFVDDGGFIRTTHENSEIIKRMLDLAEAKGWTSVHLAGSDEFRRKAWLEAQLKGLKTTGYEPDGWDQDQLSKRFEVIKGGNSVGDSRLVPEANAPRSNVPTEAQQQSAPASTPTPANVVNINKARTERYAKPVTALLKMVGSSDPDIERTLDGLAKTIDPKRAYVGELLDHGAAPYKFDAGQAPNYYVRLKLNDGTEQTLWGVDLPRALGEAHSGTPEPGDYVLVGFEGSKTVRLPHPQKNGEWIESKRNQWLAERVRDLPARLRKQDQQSQGQGFDPAPVAPPVDQQTDLASNVAQLLKSKGANEQAVNAAMATLNRGMSAAGVSPQVATAPTIVQPVAQPPLSPSV